MCMPMGCYHIIDRINKVNLAKLYKSNVMSPMKVDNVGGSMGVFI